MFSLRHLAIGSAFASAGALLGSSASLLSGGVSSRPFTVSSADAFATAASVANAAAIATILQRDRCDMSSLPNSKHTHASSRRPILDGPGRREAAFSHSNGSKV